MVAINNLVDVLIERSKAMPDITLYHYLKTGEVGGDYSHYTYQSLLKSAASIAAHLDELGYKVGDRAMLLYPQGIEFISAFWGCLLAGVIAVPVSPPGLGRIEKNNERLLNVAKDADIKGIITCSSWLGMKVSLAKISSDLSNYPWVASDALPKWHGEWKNTSVDENTVAYFQYTSGSTGLPKGVVISHGNLINTLADLDVGWEHNSESCMVSWLPSFHDLGLIYGILHPVYFGYKSVLMAPAAFIQKPKRWLSAISHFKGTHTAAPNFAYDLCLNKIKDEDLEVLDLSSLKVMMNAAEPVRVSTLNSFSRRYSRCGLKPNVMSPSYGMAEATLKIATTSIDDPATILYVDAEKWVRGLASPVDQKTLDAVAVIGCGRWNSNMDLRIVDPTSFKEMPEGNIGEIWVAGKSVAQGYWNNSVETKNIFQAKISPSNEGPFMRTGDLGFVLCGQVFFAGRQKDLIIVRGSNYYPQDLEQIVERSSALVVTGGVAAFELDSEEETRIGIVAEILVEIADKSGKSQDEIYQGIVDNLRKDVVNAFDIDITDVCFIRSRTLPKTSSGKIQRRAAKLGYINQTLNTKYRWNSLENKVIPKNDSPSIEKITLVQPPNDSASKSPKNSSVITAQLVKIIHQYSKVKSSHPLDFDTPFAEYGFDSRISVEISGVISEKLNVDLAASLLYEYPTLRSLSQYLESKYGDETLRQTSETMPPKLESASVQKEKLPSEHKDKIAIVGIACRYPGGISNPSDFWTILEDGGDAIIEIPSNRWNVDTYYDPTPSTKGKSISRWGGFISDVDKFDAEFFNISPVEARSMDPQQRCLLEVTWEALENAGFDPDTLKNTNTGVFIGTSHSDYEHRTLGRADCNEVDAYCASGVARSVISGRLSYFFDFAGPSINVDTACSSSLASVHLACESIRKGESSMAIAGGVNLVLSPNLHVYFSQIGALAADGRCKTFADNADGYVRSEGCGVLILKSLEDAIRDGNQIHGVICGSAMNQDGKTNGLTAPSKQAQVIVLEKAISSAGIQTSDIQYIEAHGTGTPLGDAVELGALDEVFTGNRPENKPLYIGSVKTNIGHCEAAAGVAGLIKALLMLKNKKIVKSINRKEKTSKFLWDKSSLSVNDNTIDWPSAETKRYAGVSSFGFSGTNVHIVLSEGPNQDESMIEARTGDEYLTLPLSGINDLSLKRQANAYLNYIRNSSDFRLLQKTCVSAYHQRKKFRHRMAVVGRNETEMVQALSEYVDAGRSVDVVEGVTTPNNDIKVAFVFPGQGHQWVGMAKQLMTQYSVFSEAIIDCHNNMKVYTSWSLLSELDADKNNSILKRVDVAQPVIFAIQVSLARLWQSWGISPAAVIGHSMGEIAAAHIAGALTLDDAIKIICTRSKLISRLEGAMALVALDAQRVEAMCDKHEGIEIAAYNGPTTSVITGNEKDVTAFMSECDQAGIFCRKVDVDFASHSSAVDSVLAEFGDVLAPLFAQASPLIGIYSSSQAKIFPGSDMNANYWCNNLRKPVLFSQTVKHMLDDGFNVFIEMSGHPTLVDSVRNIAEDHQKNISVFSSLKRDEDNLRELMKSMAGFYSVGGIIAPELYMEVNGPDYSIPSYSWEKERFWIERTSSVIAPNNTKQRKHGILGEYTELLDDTGSHMWIMDLDSSLFSIMNEHQVGRLALLPATVYIDCALSAFKYAKLGSSPLIKDMDFLELINLNSVSESNIQLIITPKDKDVYRFRFRSRGQSSNVIVTHCEGTIISKGAELKRSEVSGLDPDLVKALNNSKSKRKEIYEYLKSMKLNYGHSFQGLERVSVCDGTTIGEVLPNVYEQYRDMGFTINPVLLDIALHTIVAEKIEADDLPRCLVPVSIGEINILGSMTEKCYCLVKSQASSDNRDDETIKDVIVFNDKFEMIATLKKVCLKEANIALSDRGDNEHIINHIWEEKNNDIKAVDSSKTVVFVGSGAVLSEISKRCSKIKHPISFVKQTDLGSLDLIKPDEAKIGHIIYAVDGAGLACDNDISNDKPDLQAKSAIKLVLKYFPTLAAYAESNKVTLSFLVSNGFSLPGKNIDVNLVSRSVWGYIFSAASEYNHLPIKLLNVFGKPDRDAYRHIVNEVLAENKDIYVGYQQGRRLVARLQVDENTDWVEKNVALDESKNYISGSDSTHVITGGTGGLGISLATYLIRKGAKNIALVSRSGHLSKEKLTAIQELSENRCDVQTFKVDVSQSDDVSEMIGLIEKKMPRIKSIYHLAGGLSDLPIALMRDQDIDQTFDAKAIGAWNLHQATIDCTLDRFVLFSSGTALISSPNQANYTAANCFLDGLASMRAEVSLPALSINFGVFTGVGILSQEIRLVEILDEKGIAGLDVNTAFDIMEAALQNGVSNYGYINIDFDKWLSHNKPLSNNHYWSTAGRNFVSDTTDPELIVDNDFLVNVLNANKRRRNKLLTDEIRLKISDMIGVRESKIDNTRPFSEMGMDSISGVRLKNEIEAKLNISLPSTLIWKYPYLDALVNYVADVLDEQGLCKASVDEKSDVNDLDGKNELIEESLDTADTGEDIMARLLDEIDRH